MGTNFYMRRKDARDVVRKMLDDNVSLYDISEYLDCGGGRDIHLAKTSAGWLPVFETQQNPLIRSVADIKKLYETGDYEIYDEYNTPYTWEEFDKRVLQFNGGTIYKRVIQPVNGPSSDPNMPDHTPVSHFEYANGKYANEHFMDPEGYEFINQEFC